MVKYYVRFEKHVTKAIMTYHVTNSWHDASETLRKLKSINTVDYCFIDEVYSPSFGDELSKISPA